MPSAWLIPVHGPLAVAFFEALLFDLPCLPRSLVEVAWLQSPGLMLAGRCACQAGAVAMLRLAEGHAELGL